MKRWKSFLPALLLGLALLLICRPETASAATDSITVKVGYFGGPYYEKTVLTMSDLERLEERHEQYTFLDRGGFLAYADAYGYGLADVLEMAGVDVQSISRCHFKTEDSYGGYFVSMDAGTLFWSDRYAFPTLSEYYGRLPWEINRQITDVDAVWSSAVSVPAMLSHYDNYSRVSEFRPYDPNDYDYTGEKGLRLFFGQTAPDTVNANQMAKYVYEIDVEFGGAPTINVDQDQLKLKVGSDYRVQVSVSSADEVITQAILQGLEWSSSDESVVTVDQTGQITVVGKGSASITVRSTVYDSRWSDAYGGMKAATIHIAAGDDENLNGGGTGTGDGSGTGSGGDSGTGDSGTGDSGTGADDGSDQSGTENGNDPGTGGSRDVDDSHRNDNTGISGGTNQSDTAADPSKPDDPGKPSEPNKPNRPSEPSRPGTGGQGTAGTGGGTDQSGAQAGTATPGKDEKEPDSEPSGGKMPPAKKDEIIKKYIESQTTPDLTKETEELQTLRVGRLSIRAGAADPAETRGGSTDSSASAEQVWRRQGMASDATALGLILRKNPLAVLVAVSAVALVLLGGGWMYIRFKRETKE